MAGPDRGRSTRIVASVQPRGPADLAALDAAVSDPAADVVEVRADLWEARITDLRGWIERCVLPVIATLRRRDEGGSFGGSEADRLARLTVLAPASTWIDLEWRSRDEPGFSALRSRRHILSLHALDGVPPSLEATVAAMSATSCDLVKVAATPADSRSLARLLALGRDASRPTAVMAMGEHGAVTRALAGKLGAPFVYGSVPGRSATAPGQLSIHELDATYRVRTQTRETRVFAVAGSPIGHSLSPALHNPAFAAAGLDAVLVPLLTPDIADFERLADVLGLQGAAITIPLKEAAARAARGAIGGGAWPPPEGVCNTLLRKADQWLGANTDRTGFLAALDAAGPQTFRRALLLGAGGSARSAAAALAARRIDFVVASRTPARARALARAHGRSALAWDERLTTDVDLIVNTTPVGMHPAGDASPLEGYPFHAGQTVIDLIYRPRRTRLLETAAAAGATTVEGGVMFLAQARAQFGLFSGRPAPAELLAARLEAARHTAEE